MSAGAAIRRVSKRYVDIRLTHEQVRQLFSLAHAANHDGDHRDWLKSAGATPGQVRALSDVMKIVNTANSII